MKANTIMIGVDYEEAKPETYQGILVSIDKGENIRFYDADKSPNEDVHTMVQWVKDNIENMDDAYIMSLSSVDHYVMDGGDQLDYI